MAGGGWWPLCPRGAQQGQLQGEGAAKGVFVGVVGLLCLEVQGYGDGI